MDDVSVDAHNPETGGNGDWFVSHHPDPAREPVHLHRERRRWIQGAVPTIFQDARDRACGFIENFAAAMELLVGHAASCRSDVFAIHLHDQRDVAAGAGQRLLDVRAFRREIRIVHRRKRDVVGSRGQADRPEPVGIDHVGPRRSIRSISDHFLHGRVLGKAAGKLRHHPRYTRLYSGISRNKRRPPVWITGVVSTTPQPYYPPPDFALPAYPELYSQSATDGWK